VARSKQGATYEDLLKLPEHVVGEIIDGELIVSPRPSPAHSNAETAIAAEVGGPFSGPPGGRRGPGGWWILLEPELHLGPDVLVPDLAGWRRERMPRLPSKVGIELPPDWLCEVVSPSTERIDRSRKLRVYARVKVPHVWLVNPLARTLEVLRLEGESWHVDVVHDGDALVRVPPFDAVELELSRWWPGPEEETPL
jgi:Uma2 family endonuclease